MKRLLLVAISVTVFLFPLAPAAEAQTTPAQIEAQAHHMLNQYRAAHGLPALPRHSGLDADARGWSTFWGWVAPYTIWHSPNFLTDTARHTSATVCANENIGHYPVGSGYPLLHHLFVHSPSHNANMLGHPSQTCGADWNRVGIGAAIYDGQVYVTFRFARW
jgi:uncharacterized protein YkwD